MGCLNDADYGHWFANVHLSGPCNRSCYFCIGQHMMALDPLNTLHTWPLPGWQEFIKELPQYPIQAAYITGSNTDPLLASVLPHIVEGLKEQGIPEVGLRTNGVRPLPKGMFDRISVSITSLDPDIYRTTMGSGRPPTRAITDTDADLKVNIVLCPEILGVDLWNTLEILRLWGVRRVNLREPYGQAFVGDPIGTLLPRNPDVLGNASYQMGDMEVVYWDVHSTHVSSVNLYANGNVSTEYSVTKGHAATGTVLDQSHFTSGRHRPQWVKET